MYVYCICCYSDIVYYSVICDLDCQAKYICPTQNYELLFSVLFKLFDVKVAFITIKAWWMIQ